MLVLARKKNEELVIGNCRITVIEIRGEVVRLGIEAPADVPVHRKEVLDALQKNGELRKKRQNEETANGE